MPVDYFAPNRAQFDYLDSLQALGNAQTQRQQNDIRGYAFNQQKQQDQMRPQIQQQAAAGDFEAAKQQAFSLGDYDALKYVSGLEAAHHERLAGEADAIGGLAASLTQLPQEQRAQAFAAAAPRLKQLGFDDNELAQVNLSDAGLQAYMALATDAKTALQQYRESQKPTVLADGSQLYQGGKMIAENARDARWQFDAESGSWLQEPGTGGNMSVPQPGYVQRGGGQPSGGMGGGAPRSVRNNNPGNIEDGAFARSQPGYQGSDGRFAIFNDPQAGAGAQSALLGSYIDRGFDTVSKIINRWAPQSDGNNTGSYVGQVAKALGVDPNQKLGRDAIPALQRIISRVEGGPGPSSGVEPAGQPGVVNVRAPRQKAGNAPSGYRFNGDRLEPIPGGPADPSTATSRNVQSNRKAEADYRKEFDQLPEVKTFKTARQQFNTIRDLAKKPNATAQDDIAIIFGFMRTLDPTSTVREGEFATAQNAAGIPDNIRNSYNKAINGTRLNPQQRQHMVESAYASYKQFRDAYNQQAENYRSYARDNGINPDRVARTYTPDKPTKSAGRMGQFKIVKVQ